MSKNRKNYMGIDGEMLNTKGKGIVEDTTEYGEFVATFDAWMTPEEQKRRAKYIENIGEERNR